MWYYELLRTWIRRPQRMLRWFESGGRRKRRLLQRMARGARNPGRGSRIKMKDKYQGSRVGGLVGAERRRIVMTRSVQDCRWDQCSSQNIAKSSKIVKVKVGRERGNCCREWQGEQAQLNICLRFFIWRLHNQVYYVKYTTKLTCKACEMRKSRIIIDTPWQCPKVLIGTLIWKCGWPTDQSDQSGAKCSISM